MSFRFARLSRTAVMASLLTAALAAVVWQSGVQAQSSPEQVERQSREQAERAVQAERQRQEALQRAARTEAELREQQQVRLEQLRRFRENQEREAGERERRGAGSRGEHPLRLSEDQLAELQERARHAAHRHPNVTSARARLEQTEAEFRRSMLEAASEALEIQFSWLQTEQQIDELTAQRVRTADEPGRQQQLAAARQRLAELGLRRSFLLGDGNEEDTEEEEEEEHGRHGEAWPVGPMAGKLAEVLAGPLHLEFLDTPVRDAAPFLADTLKIPFHLDRRGLEEAGLEATLPLNIEVSDVPVGAGLQALTDLHPELAVVVTDYGLVLTAREGQLAERYISAHTYWRETLEDREEEESAEDEVDGDTRRPGTPFGRDESGDAAE
ncbi:MAG: hypothetical protein KDA79_24410, partial [Planctomycetaceae bacterium]|nr:hypothetical protein [Planctomycetaceae bacterium]